MSFKVNPRKRVVEVLYFNEKYGTCLAVHKYNTDVELDELKKRYGVA